MSVKVVKRYTTASPILEELVETGGGTGEVYVVSETEIKKLEGELEKVGFKIPKPTGIDALSKYRYYTLLNYVKTQYNIFNILMSRVIEYDKERACTYAGRVLERYKMLGVEPPEELKNTYKTKCGG